VVPAAPAALVVRVALVVGRLAVAAVPLRALAAVAKAPP
jgi:hypothetical protein